MGRRDPRVDAYIAKSPEYARPILAKLRELIHQGCPEVEETIKWSAPFFEFHGLIGGMAAFKAHCGFGFWKEKLVFDSPKAMEALGQFGRIAALADLPPDEVFVGYVRKAAELNASGEKVARPKKHAKPPLRIPKELAAAFELKKHAKAKAAYEGFAPSHRREYVEWIEQAKRPETRARRIASTLEWLAQGKRHNWQYEKR